MAFHFKLEKVLRVKKKEKELLEAEYAQAVQMFEQMANNLYELLKRKEEIEHHSNEQFKSKMVVNDLQNTQRYLLSLTQKIAKAQIQVQKARELMKIAEQQFVSKTIEVKKYEKLKERQMEEYKRTLFIEENKQNDEFSILRYINQ
ncbi:flagellar export protein FliJ [Fictibacillus sp. Mic-4]|uniref:flagellar export protein FliJ n=1 Tax=Fictibacillus TaxID=1329200 RepID=UPI0003FA7C9D|nr:flagellar export protein FliJ [Fictibacillus gelatini]